MKNAFIFRPKVIISLLFATIIGFAFYVPLRVFFQESAQLPKGGETWMTVFVHGSFGSLLGFLSFSDVLSDKISGTTYRAVTKKMRMDDYFFKEQPILQRGLFRVTPTFNPADVGGRKYAVYPLAKAFEVINQTVVPGKENLLFYTFGWSGLISQASRRYEAIRFYNALQEELERLKAQGVVPKIRIVAHSHGGNLALNLAAINKILEAQVFDQQYVYAADPDEQETVSAMAKLFTMLTTQEVAHTRPDQKMYDYVPFKDNLIIDELIMFGTPIQPETESFCYAPTFKKVYNFYSDEDLIQRADWVSSKKTLSGARVTKKPSLVALKTNIVAKLIQVKIVIKSPLSSATLPVKTQAPEGSSFLEQLFGKGKLLNRTSSDPTHKELWFFTWNQEGNAFISPFMPLPVVAFTPLLCQALAATPETTDAVITMQAAPPDLSITVDPFQQRTASAKMVMPLSIVAALQEQTKPWRPDNLSGHTEFEVISKYLM